MSEDPDPMAGVDALQADAVATQRQQMFVLSVELWNEIGNLRYELEIVETPVNQEHRDRISAAEQKALALSLYLKDEAS